MSDKSFRVLLDLTDLKVDSLKYVWINVSPQELLTIADFKSSILRKINLESTNIKLYVRKGLLLDSETTTILRENDTVKVHYADQLIAEESTLEKCVKENRKSSRKRIHAECIGESSVNANEFSKDGKIFENRNNQDEINTKHKRKKTKHIHFSQPENSCTQSIASETNNLEKLETRKKKYKKLKTSEKDQTDLQICEFFSFNNSECTVLRNKDKTSLNTNLEISDLSKANLSKDTSSVNNVTLGAENEKNNLKMSPVEDSNNVQNNTSKKKRKRRKKRKKINEAASDITDSTNNQSEFKSFEFEVNKSFQGKHIRYSPSPSKEEAIDCDDSSKDIENPKAETFVLNGSLSNCTVDSSYSHPKISTPAQSNKLENPNWCLSGMQNSTINSPVKIYKKDLGLSATNSIPNSSWNSSSTKSCSRQNEEFKTKEKPSDKTYSELPRLNARPDIGTHKTYKKNFGLSETNSIPNSSWNSYSTKSYSRQSEEFKTKEKPSEMSYSELPRLNARPDVGTRVALKKDLGTPSTNSYPNSYWDSTNSNSFSRQSEEFKTKEKQSEKSYSELPPLNARPDVGTHLAYKVLELDEHYSPVVSDYREGIVTKINFENEEMEIELLKHMIKPGRTGKFENLSEGEIPLPEVKKYDTVKWSSLVEPKLLSC